MMQQPSHTPELFPLTRGWILLFTLNSLGILASFYLLTYPGALIGGDGTSHALVIDFLKKHLQELDFDIWHYQFSCGTPAWIYYQPLGHLLTAFFGIFIPCDTLTWYKIVIAGLIALFPWNVLFSFRWMGMPRHAVFFAAFLCMNIHCFHLFGIHPATFYKKGLFTMIWGVWFGFPTLAALYRVFHPLGGVYGSKTTAALWLGFTFLAHPVIGLICSCFAAVACAVALWNTAPTKPLRSLPLAILLLVLALGVCSLQVLQEYRYHWKFGFGAGILTVLFLLILIFQKNPHWPTWKANLGRLLFLYILANVLMLPFTLPMVLYHDHYGGFPYDEVNRLNGIPWEDFLKWYAQGYVLDYRLPWFYKPLTCFFALFLILFLFHRKQRIQPLWQVVFYFWIVMMISNLGYNNFKGFVYLNLANFGIPHDRYMAGVLYAALMAVALSLNWFYERGKTWGGVFYPPIFCFLFLVPSLLNGFLLRLDPQEVPVLGYQWQHAVFPLGKIPSSKAGASVEWQTALSQRQIPESLWKILGEILAKRKMALALPEYLEIQEQGLQQWNLKDPQNRFQYQLRLTNNNEEWIFEELYQLQERYFKSLDHYYQKTPIRGRTHNAFTSHPFLVYLPSFASGAPIAQSWGISSQETNTTFYLQCDSYYWNNPRIVELFAMEYAIGGFKAEWIGEGVKNSSFLNEHWEAIDFGWGTHLPDEMQESDIALFRYRGSVELFRFISLGAVYRGSSKSARSLLLHWMKSKWLDQRSYLLMGSFKEILPESLQSLPEIRSLRKKSWQETQGSDYQLSRTPEGADWTFQWEPRLKAPQAEGKILHSEVHPNGAEASLEVTQPGWILFCTSYHPLWKAKWQGQELPIYQVSPSFMAVFLKEGQGLLRFSYHYPLWAKALWGIFFFIFFSFFPYLVFKKSKKC
jgi:hypothetical protein